MKYKTKHKSELIELLQGNPNMNFSIEDLYLYISKKGLTISQTTLYRLLNELVEEGKLAKYFIDNNHSACYQLITNQDNCIDHIHMICNKCNKIYHLDCDETKKFLVHIEQEHHFDVSPTKIVLYGICEYCR